MKHALGDRMKSYEQCTSPTLPINTPIIMRLDGRAFHTLTKKFKKPFDEKLMNLMNEIAAHLCNNIMNAKLAYIQSDEISILIYDQIGSDVWFGNKPQKMTSVSASMASAFGTRTCIDSDFDPGYKLVFDSRVFSIPEKDVCNYFIWRQRDWERNSIHMLSRSHFTHKDLHGKTVPDMHDMLHMIDENWNDLTTSLKRGRCVIRTESVDKTTPRNDWGVDNEIPIFTQERDYIEDLLKEEE